jgi:hypothetical protein
MGMVGDSPSWLTNCRPLGEACPRNKLLSCPLAHQVLNFGQIHTLHLVEIQYHRLICVFVDTVSTRTDQMEARTGHIEASALVCMFEHQCFEININTFK